MAGYGSQRALPIPSTMSLANPWPRRAIVAVALALTFVLGSLGQARAELKPAPDALPQLWGVEVDSVVIRHFDKRTVKLLRAAGVTLVATSQGTSDRERRKLESLARRWRLPIFQPLSMSEPVASGGAACVERKRLTPGSRCGLRARSAGTLGTLAQQADILVVRASPQAAFTRLRRLAGSGRVAGVLDIRSRGFDNRKWLSAIKAAKRSPQLDLVVRPRGAGRTRALERYLRLLRRHASGDRRPPTPPAGLSGARSGEDATVTWRAARDNRSVARYGVYLDGSLVGSVAGTTARIDSVTCERHLLEIDAVDRAGNRSAKAFAVVESACGGDGGTGGSPDGGTGALAPDPISPLPTPPDTAAPTAPSNLLTSAVTRTSMTLSWGASADNVGVTGYRVYRNGTLVDTTVLRGHVASALTCGTAYTFSVEAFDARGNRSPRAQRTQSTQACAPGQDSQPPSVPPNQRYPSIGQTSVTLAWDAASDNVGVAGYHLYRNGVRVASVQQLEYTFSGLSCGTSYTFALEAYDAEGNVSDRAEATGTRTTQACGGTPPPVDTEAPSVPPNRSFGTVTPTSVELRWSASSDNVAVAGYYVYRDGARVASTQQLQYVFGGLACNTGYSFAVEAYDAAGNVSNRTQATASRSTAACEEPPPASGTAHLWLDGNGGSCTRSESPVPYNDGTACGTAGQAYSVANSTSAGSTILIRGGTYTKFQVNGSRSSSNRIVFDAAPGEKPVFTGGYMSLGDGDVQSTGPDYVTLKNLTTAEFGAGYANPDNRFGIFVGQGSSFVRLENMRAGNFLIQASENIEVVGGEYGPCRASDGGQPCEINKVDHYPGAPAPKGILIDGVHFHDYDLGPSCFKPSNGGTSTGNPDCHWRSMYLNGVQDVTLRNSRFRESFIAPWMTISGPGAASTGNKNILVENNVFGTGVNYGSSANYNDRGYGRWEAFDFAWCQNASAGVLGYDNVTFRFNSSSRAVGLFVLFNDMGCQSKVRNIRSYGNIGFRNGCDPLVQYGYNVYSNSGTCSATDRNANSGGSLPFYANDTHSPGPQDYGLTGGPSPADNLVPAGMGCPATDRNGNPRGAGGFCDAGAYER